MIWFVLAVLTGLGLAALAFGLWQITRVTKGSRIPSRSGEALILIDLQQVFWDEGPYPAEARASTEAAIRAEVYAAKASGVPVIALRQEWSQPMTRIIARLTMKGQALAGTPGTELATPFVDLPDAILVKRVQDGFETGALDALLAQEGLGHLRLAGIDGNYCVAKTAEAALARGYRVTLLPDATLSADPARYAATQERLTGLGAETA